MQYFFHITGAKALTQVVMHIECYREQSEFPYRVLIWQKTELFDEDRHPEPWKWAQEHTMKLFDTM